MQSLKAKYFYVVYTNNLKNRIKEHNEGNVSSARFRRPLKLVYYEACLN
ncbi:MAG: GIY-YIG nuclease family protein [Minisyncoccia bacterium]